VALLWANSPWSESYFTFWNTELNIEIGSFHFEETLKGIVNDGLMAIFFFVVGMEIKRELVVGELAGVRKAALPAMAALGGMILPALIYVGFVFSTGGDALNGWGIPMATDIAFAIGALSLLGPRIPKNLITFLIALAIVDDLGAVAVIAVFYTESIDLQALACAFACTLGLVFLNLGGVRRSMPYAFVGIMLWVFMLASGIHATIAGILVAFVIPIRPKFEPALFISRMKDTTGKMLEAVADNPDIVHNTRFRSLVSSLGDGVALVQAPAQRAEHALHLPVAYLVIPIFALANAGIPIDFANFGSYLNHPITLGVLAGLVVGKPLGIAGFTWLVVKMGWADLPTGLNMKHILGVGLLGGIGFTMSIFIADLGFAGMAQDLLMAKTGILLASAIAGFGGFFWLMFHTREPGSNDY
jgi:Na+:H+ antiporter, NhaA family